MQGLNKVIGCDNNDRTLDVVFVHGLGGDAYSTWQFDRQQEKFWPHWLGEDLRQLGVWTLGYAADLSMWKQASMPLADRGKAVLEQLVNDGLGRRPLVFITHSMGGIVVKQCLQQAEGLGVRRWKAIAEQTRGIAFIATPHSGANLANFAEFASLILRTNEHVAELKQHDSRLADLHGWFLNTYLSGHKVICRTYCERREVRAGVLGLKLPKGILVVDATSAEPNISGERAIPLDEDHVSICKLESRTADLYKSILSFIQECLETAQPPQPAAPPLPGGRASEAIDATRPGISVPGQEPTMKGMAMPFFFVVPGQSPAQMAQTCQPRPRLEELFEIVTDPDEVPRSLFRTEAAPKAKSALVPYQVGYVQGREGVTDVMDAIGNAVSQAKGRLLICGPAGTGKTREVAEFARKRCARDWKICIALSEGDARLGELSTLPAELADAKLLVIIDNLQAKLLARPESAAPYAERLEAFLASLARQVPDNLLVIAMAHSESHYLREFDLDVRRASWHSFGLYQLPDFTLTGLQQMLAGLVAQAGVAVDEMDISKLVENSDRKPRTLFINVNLAYRNAVPLTAATWGPNEGDLWKESFLAVRGRHPVAGKVYAALRVLADAGLPKRRGYVTALSSALAGADTTPAIDGLVDKGLLGLRQGMLTAYSEEQLMELLREEIVHTSSGIGPSNNAAAKRSEDWELVISAVKDVPERPPEWKADLVALAMSLSRHQLPVRAEEMASFAIEQSAGSARAYMTRASTRFLCANWVGSESDLSAALERDATDADAHFLRGVTRNMIGDFPGMASDMDNAIKHGRNDSMVYASRGLAHYQQGQFREAEADVSAAMERGHHDPMVCLLRGMSRYQLKNFEGAEGDLTAALDHGLDFARSLGPLAAMEGGNVEQAIAAFDQNQAAPPSHQDDALLFGLRGFARIAQTRHAAAEADLTLAIEHGFSACVARMGAIFQKTTVPGLAAAKEQFAHAQSQFASDGPLYCLRGFARCEQGRLAEAESDFEAALAAGFAGQDLYKMRGMTRRRLARFAEAEEDFETAIQLGPQDLELVFQRGMARLSQRKLAAAEADANLVIGQSQNDAPGYFLRGAVRFDQGNHAAAEEDFSAAIERGQDDSLVYFLRGNARCLLRKLADAESDLSLAIEKGHAGAAGYSLRGSARLDQGRPGEAEQDLDEAIARGQNDPWVYFARGAARYHQQKLAEAEADLSLALDKGRTDADTYSLRGAARLDQGKNAEAEQDFDAAVERGRGDAAVFFVRGAARHRQQKFAEAEADLSLAVEKGKADVETYSLRGAARAALKRWAGAEQDASAAIEGGRDDAGAYYLRGRARAGQDKFAEAEGDFDAAIARGMDDADTYFRRGQARFNQNRLTEAEQDFATTVARGQDDTVVHLLLGLTRLGLERYHEAECDFDASLARDGDRVPSYLGRGRARLIQGKMEGAERDFDSAIARDPENADAYHLRGLARYGQGNVAGAVTDYDIALATGKPDAAILGDRVFAAVRLGRLDEAERDCARVTNLGTDSPEAKGCTGLLCLTRGDFENARSHFQAAGEAAGGKNWHFWLGLAHLLSGHPEAARAAYHEGIAESVLGDVRIALGDFEYWTAQHPERMAADEARRIVVEIRDEMAHRLDA